MYDVIVVGGGVIGMAIALQLHSGRSVLIIERDIPGLGASWAAAGMLSPQSEAHGDDGFFRLAMRSLEMFPSWAAALQERSGIDPECDRCGVIVTAISDDDMRVLESRRRWQHEAGFEVELLSAADVGQLEPWITADVRGGLLLAAEYRVTPRALLSALRVSCERAGIQFRAYAEAEAVVSEHGRVAGVRVKGELLRCSQVVVAGGVWSGSLQGLSPGIPLSPRKGQILSLSSPPDTFRHMIRWSHAYFVPRRSGELVVGATNEDTGFDRTLTAAGVAKLLMEAQRISPHVGALAIHETWTGLRPATPDGWPVIGRASVPGLFYAAGHYRNGVLLAPVTAAIIAALVDGSAAPVPAEPFSPQRFNV
jgi:glycine oxidase